MNVGLEVVILLAVICPVHPVDGFAEDSVSSHIKPSVYSLLPLCRLFIQTNIIRESKESAPTVGRNVCVIGTKASSSGSTIDPCDYLQKYCLTKGKTNLEGRI